MRVPQYEQQVRSAPLSPPRAVVPSAGQGLQQLGGAIQQAVGTAARIADAERQKADQFREAQIDLEFGKAINDAQWGDNGFMLQQGENALDPSKHLENLEKVRASLAGRLTESQRERWSLKAAARLEEVSTNFERHSGGQRKVLYQQVAEGQVKLALDTATLSYGDSAAVESALQKPLVEPDGSPGTFIRALHDRGLPAEQIQAEVQAYKRKGYADALTRRLQAGDIAGAREGLDLWREQLGTEAGKLDKAITKADQRLEGSRGAQAALVARDDDGYLDEGEAERAFLATKWSSPEAQQQGEAAFEEGKKRLAAVRKADVGELFRGLFAGFHDKGWAGIQGPELDRLNRLDPEKYERIKTEYDQQRREAKADRREVKAARSMADLLVKLDFLSKTPEERAALDVEEEYAGKVPEGADAPPSTVGLKTLAVEKQKAAQTVQKGDATSETEFVRDTMSQAIGVPGVEKQETKRAIQAAAVNAYNTFLAEKKRPPSDAERQALIDPIVTKAATKPRAIFGISLDNGEEYGFERQKRERAEGQPATPAAPAPKTITKYLRSPDGTRRVPVYADGSFGPEEMVR